VSRDNIVQDVIRGEAWQRLFQALHHLSAMDNEIWECRRLGLTYRSIGAKLGISHAGVRKRERAILAALARELDGFDLDDYN
jgi:DNA-directed RNA polymerase specialized sigma24 family protein